MRDQEPSTITALLGPTNTGKTHHAVEQMLTHATGMIGLPLRLLAREIYDRVSARVGEGAVALITGEEKRVPPRPRYYVCTVEAMPSDRQVDFLAVDEVQLAAHVERGHVFTDRLMHWRGRRETFFLGADTMRPMVERLVPTATHARKPRLSRLQSAGQLALRALPPRTAVVAFSVDRVYALAERVRARRGGAAVVMGALSPRTRNAQVALYQSGEVDYLVATDAIGMGLNMDVDCVAFADTRKFDGRALRELSDAELAQIAGRAGRYHHDGRFATLAPTPDFPLPTLRAIEDHRFTPVSKVYWRSADLDFASLDALAASLGARPPLPCLVLMSDADDRRALGRLAMDAEIAARCRAPDGVRLLWKICQIPDYRQLQLDDHFKLLRAVFLQLSGPRARLEHAWMQRQLARLSDLRGDIDTLLGRMAFIRTFTYIAHHGDWIDGAEIFRDQARELEDRLSDTLHERLMARFVDAKGRKGRGNHRAAGTLAEQLRQVTGQGEDPPDLDRVLDFQVESWIEAGHARFTLDDRGRIAADDVVLGRLHKGAHTLKPEAVVTLESLGAGMRLRLQRRLGAFARDWVEELLAPLRSPLLARLGPGARGLVYQLEQGLGTCAREAAEDQLRGLPQPDRSRLSAMGIRVGAHTVNCVGMFAPAPLLGRRLLCQLAAGAPALPPLPRLSWAQPEISDPMYLTMGFVVFDGLAARADWLEGISAKVRAGLPPHRLFADVDLDSPEREREYRTLYRGLRSFHFGR